MQRVGFIGVGVMGKPMAANIKKKNYVVIIYDIKKEICDEMKADGYILGDSPKSVAQQADIIISMLPSSPHVASVALGKDGIIEGIRPGAIYEYY